MNCSIVGLAVSNCQMLGGLTPDFTQKNSIFCRVLGVHAQIFTLLCRIGGNGFFFPHCLSKETSSNFCIAHCHLLWLNIRYLLIGEHAENPSV